MNPFPFQNATSRPTKVITANAVLITPSKYVKQTTQPAQDYQIANLTPQENSGARTIIIKSQASKRLNQNSKQGELPFIEEVAPIENKQKQSESNAWNMIGNSGQSLQKNKKIIQSVEIKQQLRSTIDENGDQNITKDQRSNGNRTPQPIRYGALQNENNLNQRKLNQTPQPSRYGAQRRMQTQQAKQSDLQSKFFKQRARIETQSQKFQVETVIQNFRRGNSSNRRENGGTQNQQHNLAQEFNQITDGMSPNQMKETLSKNGKAELLVKQLQLANVETIFETATQNEDMKMVKKEKYHIILFALKSLFFKKVKGAFNKLRGNKKPKPIIVCKVIANKINLVSSKLNFHLCSFTFSKLIKSYVNTPIIKKFEGVSLNSCRIMFNLLNKIETRNLKYFFINKNALPIHSINRNKIYYVLNSLFKRRFQEAFKKFASKTSNYFAIQSYYLNLSAKISKSFNLKVLQTSLKKIKLFNKNGGQNSPKKNSKFQYENIEIYPQTQDKGTIQKIEKQIFDRNKNLQELLRIFSKEKIQFEDKMRLLRKQKEEFEAQKSDKSKRCSQLKQALSSVEPLQQNQQSQDLLIQTKFPILYELFRKVQKSNGTDIVIDDLSGTLTIFQDEMKNDQLVKQWLIFQQHLWIKNKIARYEGYPEYEKKAAKRAQEEGALLMEMIKSYTKEKYSWQWVKNSITNVSLST